TRPSESPTNEIARAVQSRPKGPFVRSSATAPGRSSACPVTGLVLATLDRMDIRPARTVADVEAAAGVLDGPPRADATEAFLADPRHHLLLAWERGGVVGMVSGVEMTHPDKGTEMFLYELGVAEEARGRGIGRALTDAL